VMTRRHGGHPVYDAVIVGGGQSGVSIAFRLMREQVTNIRVLDRNPEGREGPWARFARMHTLRTPKAVTGPDLGIPSLSARAWYEARFGKDAWAGLDKIPREIWHDYLLWVRRIVGINVTNDAEVADIEPIAGGLLAVTAHIGGRQERLITRNVVLATGIEGCGRWTVPEMITHALPRERYAHTSEAIDFAALAGKRIGVVGAGASAFDNAAMALEHGAAAVDVYVRRRTLPVVNPNRWMEFTGFLRHFGDLDDGTKWRFMKLIFDMNQPPPQDAFERCARYPAFGLHVGSPLEGLAVAEDAIRLKTSQGLATADFLIVATGFTVDFAARPELGRIASHIACWSDRYRPPAGEESPLMAAYPYLSGHFQFTEKVPGAAPYLRNIFSYTFAAMPSLACSAGISALKFGADRIALGITRELFLGDAEHHFSTLRDYGERELDTSAFDAARRHRSSRQTKGGECYPFP
jgi:FAD-dependent urate hydroxylase